jgi:protein-S-isoprenylcysteine O-methyltransferase Ste14
MNKQWNNSLWFVAAIALAPLALRREALEHPAPWLAVIVGSVLLLTQPPLPVRVMTTDRVDRGSALAIYVAAVLASLACTASLILRPAPILPADPVLVVTGTIVAAAGLAFRVWSIRTLGRWFTTTVAVQQSQRVVDRGPYARLRHPSYTGTIVAYAGLAIAFGSWIGAAAMCGLLVPAYLYRIRVEERRLCEELGTAYAEYRRRTWKLVPHVH